MPSEKALHMLDPMLLGKARHVDSLQSRIGAQILPVRSENSALETWRLSNTGPRIPGWVQAYNAAICSLLANFGRICTASRRRMLMKCSMSR